jgi:hypothetical protein
VLIAVLDMGWEDIIVATIDRAQPFSALTGLPAPVVAACSKTTAKIGLIANR